MTRQMIVFPLLGLAFISLITLHIQFAGGLLILAGIVWEVADGRSFLASFKEIEKWANRRHDDRDDD